MARKRYQKGSLSVRGTREKLWIGRWRESVILPDGSEKRINKKEVLGTVKDLTRKLALRELDRRVSHLNHLDYRPDSVITFEEFAEKWKARILPTHKLSSQSSELTHLDKHLIPAFGKLPLKNLNCEMIQAWVSVFKGSPKSCRNIVATLRMLCKTAKAWGYLTTKPLEGITFPKSHPRTQRPFTLDECKRIIEAAEEPYKTAFWILAETGIRSGELYALHVNDARDGVLSVHGSSFRGRIGSGKSSNATRSCLLSEALSVHLAKMVEGKDGSELLFSTRNSKPWQSGFLTKDILYPILDRLGIERADLHRGFRHANATFMDMFDVPLKTRTSRLGHSDPALTIGVYSHRVAAAEREFVGKVGLELRPSCVQLDSNSLKELELEHSYLGA